MIICLIKSVWFFTKVITLNGSNYADKLGPIWRQFNYICWWTQYDGFIKPLFKPWPFTNKVLWKKTYYVVETCEWQWRNDSAFSRLTKLFGYQRKLTMCRTWLTDLTCLFTLGEIKTGALNQPTYLHKNCLSFEKIAFC